MTTQLKFTADDHLERRLEREKSRRGSKTLAKTVRELAIERLTQIETNETAPASQANGKEQPAETTAASERHTVSGGPGRDDV
jgi:hypothetical protein